MKAILIFNIDGTDINDIHFHAMPILESISGKEFKATSDLVLRPLPKEMRTDADDIEEDSYCQGWNECIDAITGETE